MFYAILSAQKKISPKIFLGEARRDTMLPSISSFFTTNKNETWDKNVVCCFGWRLKCLYTPCLKDQIVFCHFLAKNPLKLVLGCSTSFAVVSSRGPGLKLEIMTPGTRPLQKCYFWLLLLWTKTRSLPLWPESCLSVAMVSAGEWHRLECQRQMSRGGLSAFDSKFVFSKSCSWLDNDEVMGLGVLSRMKLNDATKRASTEKLNNCPCQGKNDTSIIVQIKIFWSRN